MHRVVMSASFEMYVSWKIVRQVATFTDGVILHSVFMHVVVLRQHQHFAQGKRLNIRTLGDGEWQVIYSRGPLLWQAFTAFQGSKARSCQVRCIDVTVQFKSLGDFALCRLVLHCLEHHSLDLAVLLRATGPHAFRIRASNVGRRFA